jgi:ATP-binding cassette subfamily B protein
MALEDLPVTEPVAPARRARDLGPLRRLWPYLAPYRTTMTAALVALIVAAVAVLAIGQAIRRLVDHGIGSQNPELLDLYFAALLGVVAVLALATFARFYCVTWLGERVVADLRRTIYGHVLDLSPAFFDVNRTGELLSRLTTDTELIQTVVGSSASVALRNALLFLGAAALLAVTSLYLTLLVALVVPVVVLPIVLIGRKVRRLSRASQDRVADLGAIAAETFAAVSTVQAYTHERIERDRFEWASEATFRAAQARIRARAVLTALVMLLVFGAVDVVMWVGGKSVFAGTMSAGEFSAFIFYAILAAAAVGALSEVWGDVQRANGAAERLWELLAIVPQIRRPAEPIDLPMRAPGKKPPGDATLGALRFEGVTFRYAGRPEWAALQDFTLSVRAGEKIALVGPSGAGKSTLFNLLLRFYDPDRGRILLDGVDIASVDPKALRARLGFVAQEPVLFAATIAENIRYGRPEASEAEVRSAAEAAAALDFIAALPEGFKTPLGERGARLSAGQRQRLAIARAILRDPLVLLLDEATSALDAESERQVQRALERLMRGRTTLVIAHRLATVLKADRIVVLDKGRIDAIGSHAELIAQGGLYAHFAHLQFAPTPLAPVVAAD